MKFKIDFVDTLIIGNNKDKTHYPSLLSEVLPTLLTIFFLETPSEDILSVLILVSETGIIYESTTIDYKRTTM